MDCTHRINTRQLLLNNKGVTLLELVIIVSIVGVLVAIIIPHWGVAQRYMDSKVTATKLFHSTYRNVELLNVTQKPTGNLGVEFQFIYQMQGRLSDSPYAATQMVVPPKPEIVKIECSRRGHCNFKSRNFHFRRGCPDLL